MTLSRRQLLRGAGLAAAWIGGAPAWAGPEAHPGGHEAAMAKRRPVPLPRPLRVAELPRFVDPLPVPPVAVRAGTAPDPGRPGRTVPLYRVVREYGRTDADPAGSPRAAVAASAAAG